MGAAREELGALFRNAARVDPASAVEFMRSALQSVLSAPSTSFQDVEASLTLLWQLGEGIPEEAFRPGAGSYGASRSSVRKSHISSMLFLHWC